MEWFNMKCVIVGYAVPEYSVRWRRLTKATGRSHDQLHIVDELECCTPILGTKYGVLKEVTGKLCGVFRTEQSWQVGGVRWNN